MLLTALYSIVGAAYDGYRWLHRRTRNYTPARQQEYEERFGTWDIQHPHARQNGLPWLWFHGASMGEINGLLPIARALQDEGYGVVFSAVTATGVEKARSAGYEAHFFPVDRLPNSNRLLSSFDRASRPYAIVFGETELWPNFISVMAQAKIPMALVNGRLSEKSVKRYSYIRSTLRPLLEKLSLIAASSVTSAERFIQLGAVAETVVVTGNAKYDVTPKIVDKSEVKKSYFAQSHPVITLGSIRPGEERFWYDAIATMIQEDILWAIVPRHPEKFDFFADELQQRGIQFERLSSLRSESDPSTGAPRSCTAKILLVDTMGVMDDFYAIAHAAFVGGTLCKDLGGHNLFEPARYGVPVIAGPEGEAIKDLRRDLNQHEALITVTSTQEIVQAVSRAVRGELESIGKRGFSVYAQHTGAVARVRKELHERGIAQCVQ